MSVQTDETGVDVREMIAVHDCMRKEYGSLPLLVKSIAEGDAARAGLVADHVRLLGVLMDTHHTGEDEILWPLVRERSPEHEAIFVMDVEHVELNDRVARIGELAETWRAEPSAVNRAALHTELIGFEKDLLRHLGHEEREVLPLLQATLTQDEFAALGIYVRRHIEPADRDLILGLIFEDTTSTFSGPMLEAMPAEARANVEQTLRPRAQEYKRRLLGM
jgi:hemerythrin-like domain-containing protein